MYAYNFSSSRIGARLEPHHHDALPLPLPLLGVKGFIYPMEKIRRSREAALNNFSPPSSLTLPPPPPPSASRPFNRMRFTPDDSSSLFLRSEARGMERIDGYFMDHFERFALFWRINFREERKISFDPATLLLLSRREKRLCGRCSPAKIRRMD